MELRILSLSFCYDSIEALKDVSLQVNSGEILGIIGPNGSGKTTLLKCINKKLNFRVGTVLIDSRNVLEMSRKEIARNIGVVPQISSVSFPFTVFDIVLMGRYPHTKRFTGETEKDIAITQHCLELTGIKYLSSRPVTEISGGEYQKVIIARALAQEPKILLLDEPTLHLDISHQIEILDLVRNLAQEKKLVIVIVLHDLNLAVRYSDRILILNKGKIFASGTPEEVINADNIREVYGVEVEINRSDREGYLNIVPLSIRKKL